MLTSFADEVCGTLARLCAYLMLLALIAIGAIALWNQLPDAVAMEPAANDGWALATRSTPAFAVSQIVFQDKAETYEIYRHPEGGRKDILHWSGAGGQPVADLEIYRPGGEPHPEGAAMTALAARMDPAGTHRLEAAGLIDSKFGTVTLLRLAGDARSCLGFIKRIDDPDLRMSGWSCLEDNLPAGRAAIGCMFNRLILLSAGNDPKLAELFARAELRRSECAVSATPVLSVDWVTGTGSPRLRGAL